jgi:GrpB-like predicted nucleotidyltransferase (UPF0157 family)
MRRDYYSVDVVEYNPQWAQDFVDEAERLARVFDDQLTAIYHIGGTSIPYMFAKPIIDILPVVRDIERVESLNDALEEIGYAPRGEYGLEGRRYFVKIVEGRHTHHVHVFEKGHPEIDRLVLFRDFLVHHGEDAKAYAELKQRLARRFPNDPPSYTDAKTAFIQATEVRANAWNSRRNP